MCIAYHRDKNESWNTCKPNEYSSESFFDFVCDERHIVFRFQNNKWYYSNQQVRRNQYDIFKVLEDWECGLSKKDFDSLQRPVINQEEFFENINSITHIKTYTQFHATI